MATANALIRVSVRSVRTWPRASTVRPAYLASMVIQPTGENVNVSQNFQGHWLQIRWHMICLFVLIILEEESHLVSDNVLSYTCQEVSWTGRKRAELPSVRVDIKASSQNEGVKAFNQFLW